MAKIDHSPSRRIRSLNWFEQHGYLPGFYGVDDVRKYGVPTEEGKSDD